MPDLWECLFSLLFPERCVLCGTIAKDGLCSNCADAFCFDMPPIREREHCLSVLRYEGAAREAILRFKFGGKAASANVFGRWMARHLDEIFPVAFDFVTWMPVSKERRRERGYDQAYLLARSLCRSRGKGEQLICSLRKRWDNPPQSSLRGRAEREKNTNGVYETVHTARIRGANLLLVDDIITTGSTLSAGMQTLYAAGADAVTAIALADAGTLV